MKIPFTSLNANGVLWQNKPVVYRFGSYVLNANEFELSCDGRAVPVEPQVFLVLKFLLENRARMVSKDELLLAVWGDAFVSETTLSSRIMAARKAIGDSGTEQRLIKTVHGRGFRFVGEVSEGSTAESICDLIGEASRALDSARLDIAEQLLATAEGMLGPDMDEEYAEWHRLKAQSLLLREGWNSDRAKNHYSESIRLAEGVGAVAAFRSARYHLATMLEVQGDFHGSATMMTAAISDPLGDEADTEARELLACSLFHQGRFYECADHARKALDCESASDSRRLSVFYGENPQVSCMFWLALSLWYMGQEEEAVQFASRATRLSEEPGQIYCLAHARQQAAIFHQVKRDFALCEHWAEAAVAIGSRQGLAYREAVGKILLGWARSMQRSSSDQLPSMIDSLSIIEKLGAHMELPYFQALVAECELSNGDDARALERLEGAIQEARSRPGFFYLPELLRLRDLPSGTDINSAAT